MPIRSFEDRTPVIAKSAYIDETAVLKPRVVLAAGSLVPGGMLEGGFLWVGSPARRARALTEREIAHLEYSATHHARLKERHRAGSQ